MGAQATRSHGERSNHHDRPLLAKRVPSFSKDPCQHGSQATHFNSAPTDDLRCIDDRRLTDPAQFDRMCRWAASAENHATVARLAFQLRESKAKNGAYPDPRDFPTPNDMLTGRPIDYSRTTDGFVLRFAYVGIDGNRVDVDWEW